MLGSYYVKGWREIIEVSCKNRGIELTPKLLRSCLKARRLPHAGYPFEFESPKNPMEAWQIERVAKVLDGVR